MKPVYSKLFPCALIALGLITVQTRVAAAFDQGNVRVVSTATFNTYTAGDPGSCNPSTYNPKPGDPACVAFLGSLYNATGDIIGTVLVELSYTAFANQSDLFTDYQIWNGTISGHGSGSFIVRESGFGQPDGSYNSQLQVIDGTGTGDLAGVSGFGYSQGNATAGVNTFTLRFPGN